MVWWGYRRVIVNGVFVFFLVYVCLGGLMGKWRILGFYRFRELVVLFCGGFVVLIVLVCF